MDPSTETPSVFDELEQEGLFDYASTKQRFINFLFDTVILVNLMSLIIGGIIGIIMVINGIDVGSSDILNHPVISRLFNYVVGCICIICLYTLMEGSTKGRSLGKLVTRTQVLKEDGSIITYKDAFLRSLCRIVPFEMFSALGGYPWHDRWTKTIVVKKRQAGNML